MKKLQILVCALLFGSVSVNAQKKKNHKSSAKPKVEFGIKAGASLSKITGHDENYTYNNKLGYYGGLVAKYSVAPKFDLQAELLYSMLGTGMKARKEDYINNGNLNMSYVTLPIMAQFKISRELYIEGGPEFSFLVDSKLKDKESSKENEWKDRSTKFNIAIGFGGGYYFTNNIAVNLRANLAVGTPIAKTSDLKVSEFRLNNFQLGLTYFFK